jgi:hypothetical protein
VVSVADGRADKFGRFGSEKSTTALPSIPDLEAAMSVFDPLTAGLAPEADIRAPDAEVRI